MIVYLDNNTTTKPLNTIPSAVEPFLNKMWGIPGSHHFMGKQVARHIEKALQHIYDFVGVDKSYDFNFVCSNDFAIKYLIMSLKKNAHFVVSCVDESSVSSILGQFGLSYDLCDVDGSGYILPESIDKAICDNTLLVSIPCANGTTGVIHPIEDIADICKRRNVMLHLNITHVLGKMYYDFNEICPDFITFDGRHFHSPIGTGGIFFNKKLLGTDPEDNVTSLIALGEAASHARRACDAASIEVGLLRDKLEKEILRHIPFSIVLFRESVRLPNTTVIVFPGIHQEAMLYTLSKRNLYASIGNKQSLSQMLKLSNIDNMHAQCAVSFSLSRFTSEVEIDQAIDIIIDSANQLKKLSMNIL